jgi:hypothetical protein
MHTLGSCQHGTMGKIFAGSTQKDEPSHASAKEHKEHERRLMNETDSCWHDVLLKMVGLKKEQCWI